METKDFVVVTEQQGTVAFTGQLLGEASSEEDVHTHDDDFGPARSNRRMKCHACRWLETKIYRRADGVFVAHTIGRSSIPGEVDYARVFTTPSAFELVEVLTVRRGRPFLPLPSARALAQAAAYDDKIENAYVNRAVS